MVETINVLTQHNDNSRTGANLQEVMLTTSNVNQRQFGKLFERQVDGEIYAQPLYVGNLTIPNKGTHNVVYVATMHNSVYAFNADDPQATTPLWKTSLGPAAPLPDPNIGPFPNYRDISVEVGIISTPVISLTHNALYALVFTKIGNTYAHRLHALDLMTGAEKFGGPVQLQANVVGTSADSVNGRVIFTSHRQLQRSALLLANDTIYIAFAAYGDKDFYHGWVFAHSASTLQQSAVFNTTPNGTEAGIWMAGQGPSADSNNNIYLLTGNGSFDSGGSAWGDCFLKFRPNLTILDWFSPFDNSDLSNHDADVGSSGALLIPNTNLLVGGGKESKFHLMQTDKMGHINAQPQNSQIVQDFYVTLPDNLNDAIGSALRTGESHHIHGGPVYWNGPHGPWIYVWPEDTFLKAFALVNGKFQTKPAPPIQLTPQKPSKINAQQGVPISQSTTRDPTGKPGGSPGMPGGILSISANGSTPGSGIVWASHPYSMDANQAVVPGIVRAFDASDLTKELWNSKQNASRDDIGNFAKFCPPTIANGKVYMASFSGHLAVYGPL